MIRSSVTRTLFASLFCSVVCAQRMDQVVPLRGPPASGSIVSVSPTEVVIKVRGAEQKFSVLDIKRVTAGEEPRELATARDAIQNGQVEKGLDELKRIDPSLISNEIVKQELDFYTA